ncbi:hypothetical protein [Nocardia sp. NPDC127526]|uniref:hypothetical protein n=1 Tax=Nocardia sp. NPDC127526 TaxID=3345393 RepID=UPI00362BA07A
MSRTTAQSRPEALWRMPVSGRPRQPVEEPPLRLRVDGGTARTDDQWTVPKTLFAESVSGKLVIDFTRAHCVRREIDVHVRAGAGAIVMIVPRGWRIDLDGVQRGGGTVTNKVTLPRFPGAPLIRVQGQVETGTVKARYAYRSPLNWFRRSR